MPKYEPPPKSERDRIKESRIDLTVLQESFWLEFVGIGVVFLIPQEGPTGSQVDAISAWVDVNGRLTKYWRGQWFVDR